MVSKLFSFFGGKIQLILIVGVISILTIGTFSLIRLGAIQSENKQLQKDIIAVTESFNEYKKNALTVEKIEEIKMNTIHTQNTIRETIRDVPVNAEDRPFITDPGLNDRVDIMRQYQEKYTSN